MIHKNELDFFYCLLAILRENNISKFSTKRKVLDPKIAKLKKLFADKDTPSKILFIKTPITGEYTRFWNVLIYYTQCRYLDILKNNQDAIITTSFDPEKSKKLIKEFSISSETQKKIVEIFF